MKKNKHLFSKITVNGMTINNRVVMAPMGTNFGEQNGEMSFLHIEYYKQRAAGGVGLIIVENASVDSPEGSNGTTQLRIDHDNYIPRLFKLCEEVHKHGTKISIQLNHAGASALSSRTDLQPVSSSNIPSKQGGEVPRSLKKEELVIIAKKYGAAALRAKKAGFDAVEVHAGHSYLIAQFLSPLMNKRQDEYGGSPENRARFAKMIMDEVRAAVGPRFPIMIRISGDELIEGGNTQQDMLELLGYFGAEADIIDVSAGINASIQYQIDSSNLDDGWRSYMSKAIREKFKKPTITTGNIRDPKIAEKILEDGCADFIGIGRGLIADPEWVNKVSFGKEDTIRKCISCNIGCAGHRMGLDRPIRCTVNPSVNEWETYLNQKISKPCNVIVIGGGTAGLEAACTAAEVGCTTFLIEKKNHLGGLAREISRIPDKSRIKNFPNYLEKRAEKLRNLIIFTGIEAKPDFVKMLKPDIVVNATGSVPLLPPIKGLLEHIDKGRVYSILRMINNQKDFAGDLNGKKVAVIGGGAVGLDVVEFFAPKGAEVSIVEMLPSIGRDLDPISKARMNEIFEMYHVKQLTSAVLQQVQKEDFIVKLEDGTITELPFDFGFVCLGMKSGSPILQDVEDELESEDVEFLNVGDALRARRIIEGVQEGRNILMTLTKRGYLKRE
ncbi:MAG: FAD-dependent oxidoreductase [Lachnospiraceae bacterium]